MARSDSAAVATPSRQAALELAEKVAFLRHPASYPGSVIAVEAIETHMSWLFLTEAHAYKLKKPFCRNGIDYGTPALRRRNCRRELRLNRRLAAGVYLDVLPLVRQARGALAIGAAGEPVDWLLRMRRLPSTQTLEAALCAGRASAADAHALLERLAPFFAGAAPARMGALAYRRRLRAMIASAAARLRRPEFHLDAGRIDGLGTRLDRFVRDRSGLFDERTGDDRIVEGHGDLRPEHIYLTQPIQVIDCIEFDRALRLRDPVDELAFLALECDRCGRPEMDAWLFAAYRELAGDDPPRALVEFYKAANAFKRAHIAAWHMEDPETGPARKWIDRANDYLASCHHCLSRAEQAR